MLSDSAAHPPQLETKTEVAGAGAEMDGAVVRGGDGGLKDGGRTREDPGMERYEWKSI